MLETISLLSILGIFPLVYLFSKKKKGANKIEEAVEYDPENFYFIKHSCGKKTPVSKRFIISHTFECIHCHKKVTPKQLRCMRCTALIDLKSITPLFHSPIQCKACKLKFELPSKKSHVL
ncbi:hypothetical protein MJH12_14710 [bacterium]|nr:hypothetical protein [bacterium]